MSAPSLDLVIDDLTSEGSGVGRSAEGRAIFVPRTIPGEEVRARLVKEKRSWARAELVEILTPGSDRRPPRCRLHHRCGGCQLQHITYARQVAWKADRIREALARIGGIEVGEIEVEPAPDEFGYRNRISFTLRRLGGARVVAGFRDRESAHRIVNVTDECLLPESGVIPAWTELRARWGQGAERLPSGAELRLTLRATDDGVVLVIEGGETGNTDVRDAGKLIEEIPALLAVWHRPEGETRALLLGGARTVDDRWFGEVLALESSAFLQVNREGAHAVHRAVLGELGDPAGQRIVDAYAGVAPWGRRLARHGARVIAIEFDDAAVRVARHEIPEGLEVWHGRVEEHLADALPADRVLLNPPRAGIAASVIDTLLASPVPRVIYVSCDPATLARDLARLAPGYEVRRVRGFDLFPQTAHVETVVTLEMRADGGTPSSTP
ncbi:MAG: class I SAM-dependent RNA methyltransferase [Longimicrobiales bacterium]|nr:class I SAM-dependent RNA methyltransferase [Longimicrobiales bacterium]